MSIPNFVLDKRVVDRNVAKGIISRDDVAESLAKLPDVEANAEICDPEGLRAEAEAEVEGEAVETE